MITYPEALACLRKNAMPSTAEWVTLEQALGAVTAENIIGSRDIPSFDNSAMDGFAVRSQDCELAAKDRTVVLPITKIIAAGDQTISLLPETTCEIMTGAPLPQGADAVIPVEDVTVRHDAARKVKMVVISRPVRLHENVRFKGEDFKAGDYILPAGVRLTPEHIMALAALGIGTVKVRSMPEIHILATGNELTEDLGQSVAPGKIYNSNSPYLLAACRAARIPASYLGLVADEPSAFKHRLERPGKSSSRPRILISTGAVSKGVYDFIPSVLKELGSDVLFHRVAIKPGKPILFARLPNGDYFFGLPGNPISTAVGFRFFVIPLMRTLLGLEPEIYESAGLARDVRVKSGVRHFLKAKQSRAYRGDAVVDVLSGQESFKISPLLEANGWAIIEENCNKTEAGAKISFAPFDAFPSNSLTPETEEMQQCLIA